jgi:hypothetical protein
VSTVPPIRREILVDADPAVAFEVFTAGIGRWWPVEEHSVHGKGGAVAFEDGRLVERPADGEAGYLVAAGPLTDAAGEGMTILRLPGTGQLGEATRLATEDDASVAGGFLAVTVRPWQVMMTKGS